MEIKGTVEQISQQNNACQIDGVWFTLGEKVKFQYVRKGACEYSVETTPDGQNDKVVFIKSLAPRQAQNQPSQNQPQSQSVQTDKGMQRMSALKAASRVYEGSAQEEDFKRLTVEVEKYIEQGFWVGTENHKS